MGTQDICFGLYLGNTTCCVAVNEKGSVKVPHDNDGFHNIPAIVALTDGDEIKCGRGAKQELHKYAKQSVVGVLRDISSSDPTNESCPTCPPSINASGEISYPLKPTDARKNITASAVLEKIFGKMMDIAMDYTKQNHQASLCLPAWVSSSAVTLCVEAAHNAGFTLLSVLFQPTAACIAYDLLSKPDISLVLTMHFGDTTGISSLVELSGGVAWVKESTEVTSSPGKTVTQALTQCLAEMFYRKFRADVNESKRSKQKLYLEAEKAKHALSAIEFNADRHIACESLHEGIDFDVRISRSRFESLISQKLSDLLEPTLEMLKKSSIDPSDIKQVVLSGGTCKIPRFQRHIREAFKNAEVLNSFSPDEVLATGAAIEAQTFLTSQNIPTTNGTTQQNGVSQQNGVESKDGGKGKNKKKKKGGKGENNNNNQQQNQAPSKKNKKKKALVINTRDHQPTLLSVLSSAIWCQISDRSVQLVGRHTPPLTRCSVVVPLPSQADTHHLVIYEAEAPLSEPGAEAVLMRMSLPASEKMTEINFTCQIKTDGRVAVVVTDPATKRSREVLLSPEVEVDGEAEDSSSS